MPSSTIPGHQIPFQKQYTICPAKWTISKFVCIYLNQFHRKLTTSIKYLRTSIVHQEQKKCSIMLNYNLHKIDFNLMHCFCWIPCSWEFMCKHQIINNNLVFINFFSYVQSKCIIKSSKKNMRTSNHIYCNQHLPMI